MCHIHHVYVFFYWDCTSVQNCRAIGQLFMEILHLRELGDTKVSSWMQFGCYSSHWYFFVCSFWYLTPVSNLTAIGQLVMEILHLKDLGDTECHAGCSARRVSNFNSKIPQGGIYPLKFSPTIDKYLEVINWKRHVKTLARFRCSNQKQRK